MTDPAIELKDVFAGYGRIEVLHGVSLAVPVGSVFALLGPNGAGKSTTLQICSGKIRPTRGCVHVAGSHVNGAAPEALSKAGVCRIPEGRGIFPNLTVAENLRMWTYATSLSLREVHEKAYARFPRLGERRSQLAGTLSGGEQQMLAMSRALVTDPGVLLLDEISMGLAPLIVAELYEVVAGLAEEGISILLVEQFARTALAVADYAAVMTQGRIAMVGQPADVADFVSEAYLGGAA
ncbi:MAG: branched-chain amino acid transport system ATP-binding protein [Actinomycetota bacterium]|jgi:branched-chain amino acid transport system ATP-binding protein|nr:branched-chain amino acid transport system ATP-binding protein [Actinomycetota bacterium]